MASEFATTKLSYDLEGITLAKNAATKKRKTSLFEATDKPFARAKDSGFAVVTHADYPTRSRSKSLPADLETLRRIRSGFVKENVSKVIQGILESELEGRRYVASECPALTRQLVNTLRDRVTGLELPNYKFVCTCYITKRLKPAPAMQSGCAWDESTVGVEKDGFAEYIYKNEDLVAIASVYGVYTEKKTERGKLKNSKEIIYPSIPE